MGKPGSTAYAFRLDESEAFGPYKSMLEAWIAAGVATGEPKTHALRRVICGLMDAYNGAPLVAQPGAAPPALTDLRESLLEELRTEMRAFVRELIGDSEKLAGLMAARQDNGQVSDDVLNNILEDFGRGG